MTPITVAAAAKLNLTLQVHGRRDDGYHELTSVVAFANDVRDQLTLTPGAPSSVTFLGPCAWGLKSGSDTVLTVLRLLEGRSTNLTLGSVEVEKQIPQAAGLGGGSADAAALLRALRIANPDHHSTIDWLEVAQKIGSDVPVCMTEQAQFMSGRGERTVVLSNFPHLYAVLAMQTSFQVEEKTARVFSELNAPSIDGKRDQMRDLEVPRLHSATDVAELVRCVGNDLLPPARNLMPSVGATLSALEALPNCMAASLSGAGPAAFGLFETRPGAEQAAQHLNSAESNLWVRVTELF